MRIRKLMLILISVEAFILLVSLLWMANARRAVTASSVAPNLQLSLEKDYVDVRLRGQSTQTIPFEPSALTKENRSFFIQTPDINFDGYPDLTLIHSQGLQNTYYDGWIWHNAEKRFEYEPAIRTLSSPVFDANAHRVYTYDHGSATDHTSGTYAYEGGTLVQIKRVEQSYDDATGLFTLRTYVRKQGELMLSSEEKLTPAQMDARGQS